MSKNTIFSLAIDYKKAYPGSDPPPDGLSTPEDYKNKKSKILSGLNMVFLRAYISKKKFIKFKNVQCEESTLNKSIGYALDLRTLCPGPYAGP